MTTPERDLPSVSPKPRDEIDSLGLAFVVGITVATAILVGAWLLLETLTSANAVAIEVSESDQ